MNHNNHAAFSSDGKAMGPNTCALLFFRPIQDRRHAHKRFGSTGRTVVGAVADATAIRAQIG